MNANPTESIHLAAKALLETKSIFIGAGAGMGVDSGLPDFRGKEGFWKEYPYLGKLKIPFEEMANPIWFKEDPHLAWAFYGHRLNLYLSTKPHLGYTLLHKWISSHKLNSFIFTSNVDGHFQKSGFAEELTNECHGSIIHFQCLSRCGQKIWPVSEHFRIRLDHEKMYAHDPLPSCPSCQGLARPNILMFSDFEWDSERKEEQEKRMYHWMKTLRNSKLFVLEIGAGLAVPTVRISCEQAWETLGGFFLRINPHDNQVPQGTHSLAMGALNALSAIDAQLLLIE